MAGVDKIYGSDKEYDEFKKWAGNNRKEILKYFYPRNDYDNNYNRPITNLPEKEDMWLLNNCPIKFVKERIKEQYSI